MTPIFKFKQFDVQQDKAAMKVNTDSILLATWVNVPHQRILDIGTGTGLIALILAQRNPEAMIDAVEIDNNAFQEAQDNFAKAKWADRLQAYHTSIQDFQSDAYDFIICNPPFFTGGTLSENLDRNSVRHTIKMPNNELLRSTRRLLKPSGRFAVVLPYIEGLRFIEMAKSYGFCVHRQTEILPRPEKPIERLLIEFGLRQCDTKEQTTMAIYQTGKTSNYSDEYIALTKDFYL